MARLKIRLRGKTISELPLAEDRQYTAGRKDDCDIHLQAEKGISREHFRLSSAGGTWTVESLSRFGEVLVGGEKVANATLEHGMVFFVPPYEFEFLMTTGDSVPVEVEAAPASAEEGEVVPAADAGPSTSAVSAEIMAEKTFVGVAPSVPYIKVMDSQGEARELIRLDGGDSYVAGRESTCNIHIRDQRVSRRQFEIRKSGSQYSIIDLGSVNGTLLNGNPISTTDPTPLKSGDAISVLENYLYFELHDPHFKSRLELVNLQPPSEPLGNPLVPLAENPVPLGALPPVPQGYYPPAPGGGMHPPVPHGYYPPAPWGPPGPMPGPVAEPPKNNKKRLRLILVAVAAVAISYAMMDQEEAPKPQAINPLANDPLSKLTPEQKKLVKDTYQLAKSYYMQGKYAFARSELIKMQEILPAYEDSDGLMKLVNEAIDVQQQQKKQEELERARAEQEEKIQLKAAQCRKMLNPNLTRDQMENCLVEVIPFNPSHPLLTELLAQADKMMADKAAREAQNAAHAASVAKLRAVYAKAKTVDESGKGGPLNAIEAYEKVIATSLPDPGNVKGASRDRIARIKAMIDQKTAKYQAEAKKHAEEGKLKDAIISLRQARQIDPTNPYLQPQIDEYKAKLQEQMMIIYQEGILEESFGNVDGDENKPGAKQKWKRILATDITDGEYYKKAYIKMKKYGAPR